MALALGFAAVGGFFSFLEGAYRAVAAKGPAEKSASEPLVRSDPGVKPWREKDITASQAAGEHGPPQTASTKPDSGQDGNGSALPLQENGYPLPTQEQIDSANQ